MRSGVKFGDSCAVKNTEKTATLAYINVAHYLTYMVE
jgi:hypothetical protein